MILFRREGLGRTDRVHLVVALGGGGGGWVFCPAWSCLEKGGERVEGRGEVGTLTR